MEEKMIARINQKIEKMVKEFDKTKNTIVLLMQK